MDDRLEDIIFDPGNAVDLALHSGQRDREEVAAGEWEKGFGLRKLKTRYWPIGTRQCSASLHPRAAVANVGCVGRDDYTLYSHTPFSQFVSSSNSAMRPTLPS